MNRRNARRFETAICDNQRFWKTKVSVTCNGANRALETDSQFGKSLFIRPVSLPGSRVCTRANHQEMSSPNTVALVLVKLNNLSVVKRGIWTFWKVTFPTKKRDTAKSIPAGKV